MNQLFIVDTDKKVMYVTLDDKLVKTIENVWIGKNGVSTFEQAVEFDEKTPLGLFDLGVSFGIHDMNINYPYLKFSYKRRYNY